MKKAIALLATVLLASSCQSDGDDSRPSAGSSQQNQGLSERLQDDIKPNGLREHLEMFQAIADTNNGTRSSGTPGYDESAEYVAERLRTAGYRVSTQEFSFPMWTETSAPTLQLQGRPELTEGDDFVTMLFSAPGTANGILQAVDIDLGNSSPTSGCSATDFANFTGTIALLMRSNCFFYEQAANAAAAGANGVLIMPRREDAAKGVVRGTLTADAAPSIPVMGVSYALGRKLVRNGGVVQVMEIHSLREERTTRNVIAESRSGNTERVIMLGGHLDSVPFGPGINDNGSGTAAILEIAEELAETKTDARVRFAFWGAEEFGLLGSIHYVQNLSFEDLQAIDAYLNFDMLGSSNFVRFVYDGRRAGSDSQQSVKIQEIFEEHFADENLPTELVPLEDRSDHAAFAASGIDVGGLFSGADELKTRDEMRIFGGRVGELHDPCYHLPCDTIDQVDFEILEQMADAAAHALIALAGSS